MKRSVLCAFGLLVSFSVNAADWKHVFLTSADGTKISLDYQSREENVASPGRSPVMETSAHPFWINIVNPAFDSQDRVQAVLITFAIKEGGAVLQHDVKTLDLSYAGDHRFTAETDPVSIFRTDFSTYTDFIQELSISVNDNAMGGASRFHFQLERF
ncbi:MAG: hypothetical protein A2X94_07680 [Bdellovibrionales bacterium GWB1_55_8]|nr:MAG: hypothetical protein A2X94_07680 [Bdellovibrionales bacterium GWB1_55_8]